MTPEEVSRLADLARIELSEEECKLLAPQLGLILDSVAVVQKIAGEDVEPTTHALNLTNVFRDDEVRPSISQDAALAGAPAVEDGMFRVPQIIAEEEV